MPKKPMTLIPNPRFLQDAIDTFGKTGDRTKLAQIACEAALLKAGRTRFEKLRPDVPVGVNIAIARLEATLEKAGF